MSSITSRPRCLALLLSLIVALSSQVEVVALQAAPKAAPQTKAPTKPVAPRAKAPAKPPAPKAVAPVAAAVPVAPVVPQPQDLRFKTIYATGTERTETVTYVKRSEEHTSELQSQSN